METTFVPQMCNTCPPELEREHIYTAYGQNGRILGFNISPRTKQSHKFNIGFQRQESLVVQNPCTTSVGKHVQNTAVYRVGFIVNALCISVDRHRTKQTLP
ncbi:hypothetical protein BDEG_21339 [Batrachochytrium dendrobatidis JEL423]|uniref:Uncharacterized protein n=1 Tax=Batrachochytrium dendrobatidis (strain JEL423) TaxID=403673 RepID=A0A177WB35_BATDL|nr:hypothetical protein BDEG_21339 [Batrachochytrium dendrobatidis JEL423]